MIEINEFTVRVLDRKVGDDITVKAIDHVKKEGDRIVECYIKLVYDNVPLFVIVDDFADIEDLGAQDVVKKVFNVVDEYKTMAIGEYTNSHFYYIMRNIVEVDDYTSENFRKMWRYNDVKKLVSKRIREKRNEPDYQYNFEELYRYCMYDVVAEYKEGQAA